MRLTKSDEIHHAYLAASQFVTQRITVYNGKTATKYCKRRIIIPYSYTLKEGERERKSQKMQATQHDTHKHSNGQCIYVNFSLHKYVYNNDMYNIKSKGFI